MEEYLKYLYQKPVRFGHKDCSYYGNEMRYGQLDLHYDMWELSKVELQILNKTNPNETDINISSNANGMCQISGGTGDKSKHVPHA